jgi:CubicO group peptidase (beta-lactamase class C family)
MYMEDWMEPALDYIPRWLDYQMSDSEQPGCVIAIVHWDEVVLERAFGYSDIVAHVPLTPRHWFRVASHTKCFTAAAVMKLRERGKLGLEDRVGRYVDGLHPAIADAP